VSGSLASTHGLQRRPGHERPRPRDRRLPPAPTPCRTASHSTSSRRPPPPRRRNRRRHHQNRDRLGTRALRPRTRQPPGQLRRLPRPNAPNHVGVKQNTRLPTDDPHNFTPPDQGHTSSYSCGMPRHIPRSKRRHVPSATVRTCEQDCETYSNNGHSAGFEAAARPGWPCEESPSASMLPIQPWISESHPSGSCRVDSNSRSGSP
jgi:hypothetical protein